MQRISLLNGSVLTASLVEVRVPPKGSRLRWPRGGEMCAGWFTEACEVRGALQPLACMKAKDKGMRCFCLHPEGGLLCCILLQIPAEVGLISIAACCSVQGCMQLVHISAACSTCSNLSVAVPVVSK